MREKVEWVRRDERNMEERECRMWEKERERQENRERREERYKVWWERKREIEREMRKKGKKRK